MQAYIVTTEPIQVRWTLEEAKKLVANEHSSYRSADSLHWEEDYSSPKWTAYDYGIMDSDGRAATVREEIWQVEIPGVPPLPSAALPKGAAVRLEMRVTTRTGQTSFEHLETTEMWEHFLLGPGVVVRAFAARAGEVLSDQLTEGSS
jgi:hypothetical protein